MDSIVSSVIEKFKQRSEFGQKKYGTNLDRKDLSVLDWIQHAQEELLDGILYLEKMKTFFQLNHDFKSQDHFFSDLNSGIFEKPENPSEDSSLGEQKRK